MGISHTIHVFCIASVPLFTLPAGGVIVGGTFGTGNNNATQAGLVGYLGSTSQTAFPYWNNLVRVADASGVYLGYNASTMRGWVLSANHVTTPSSITVAGSAYTVLSGIRIGNSDLKIYQIGGGLDPALPNLPTVPLASADASIGDFTLMFGRASTSSSSAPYPWIGPGTSDANGMRWGTNTIEGKYLVNIGTVATPNLQPYLVVDFDGSVDPGVTAYDAQGALGDSGGGLFIQRAGIWEVSGIAHFVDDGPDFLESIATGDNIVDPSQYGDFTSYTDVWSYSSAIRLETGTLVPEPASGLMIMSGTLLALRRRRS